MASEATGPILLFDGVCNFCNGAVKFVAPRDRAGAIRFAALQSETGEALQRRFGLDPDDLDTVILVEGDRCHRKSGAILRVARRLSGAWPLLFALWVVPAPIRDWVYGQFAKRRYRWFGRSDECMIPTPDLRERFLA